MFSALVLGPGDRRPRAHLFFSLFPLSSPGTMEYMAPEIVAGRGHGKAVDWWSVGVLVYEMLCGVPPFRAAGRAALQRQITGAKLKLPPYLSREAASLLKGLLQREPPKRLGYGPGGSDAVKAHAFFADVDWAALAAAAVESPFRPTLRHDDSVENFDTMWTDMAAEVRREGGGKGRKGRRRRRARAPTFIPLSVSPGLACRHTAR